MRRNSTRRDSCSCAISTDTARMSQVTFTAAALLREVGGRIDPADAELLLLYAAGKPRAWLFARGDEAVDAHIVERYRAWVARRQAGEPVAYLVGSRGFWTLDLDVGPGVLIPRPETELLVELALQRIAPDRDARIADLGTGSGAIALALAKERPRAQVVAVDASLDALAIARANADKWRIGNVEFRAGDWCAPLAGECFDLVASNPPYIALGDPHLTQGDLRFEPPQALASGADGLDAIRRIARDAPAALVAGGWLLLEHGHKQGAAVRALLDAAGFSEVETHRDLEARDRVTLGRHAAQPSSRL